ncbi:MAG: tetratricopeptide repeat protein, partial [Bacteroidales bacterium]|nr:tetratricopeptide repeat protein [Bacteroidales bacterium]
MQLITRYMIGFTKNIVTLLLLITPLAAFSQPDRGDIRYGNKAYSKGDIEKAEEGYRRALEKDPESFFAKYNLGNALYKRGNPQ